ncbi:MAG: hypothetical protein AB7U63_19705 [Porticoccaceae bacterium]
MKHWTWISIFAGVALWLAARQFGVFSEMGSTEAADLAATLAQISVTMLGFLIAALSILASISGHRLLREMQSSGHFNVLLRRFFINAIFYAGAMVSAFIVLILKQYYLSLIGLAFTVFVIATCLLADTGYRLWLVLHNLSPKAN